MTTENQEEKVRAAREVLAAKTAPKVEDAYGVPRLYVPTQAWLSAMALACLVLADGAAAGGFNPVEIDGVGRET